MDLIVTVWTYKSICVQSKLEKQKDLYNFNMAIVLLSGIL